MSAGWAFTPADRYSTKMASEGASGEHPPPVQALATAVLGSVDTVRHGASRNTEEYGIFTGVVLSARRCLGGKEAEMRCASISTRSVKQQRWPAGASWRCLEKGGPCCFWGDRCQKLCVFPCVSVTVHLRLLHCYRVDPAPGCADRLEFIFYLIDKDAET